MSTHEGKLQRNNIFSNEPLMKNANKPKKCIPSEDSLALSWYEFGAGGLFFKKNRGTISRTICFWQEGGISSVLESISAGRAQLHPEDSDIPHHRSRMLTSSAIFKPTDTEKCLKHTILNTQRKGHVLLPTGFEAKLLQWWTTDVLSLRRVIFTCLRPTSAGQDTLFLLSLHCGSPVPKANSCHLHAGLLLILSVIPQGLPSL